MPSFVRLSLCALVIIVAVIPSGQTQTPGTLDIYVIDVEGGNATLLVSPSKESLLIDTGNSGGGAERSDRRPTFAEETFEKRAGQMTESFAVLRKLQLMPGKARTG